MVYSSITILTMVAHFIFRVRKLTFVNCFFDRKTLEVFNKLLLPGPVLLVCVNNVRFRIWIWLCQSWVTCRCSSRSRMHWAWSSHTRTGCCWWWAALCCYLGWGHARALPRDVGLRLVPARSPHPSAMRRIYLHAKPLINLIQTNAEETFEFHPSWIFCCSGDYLFHFLLHYQCYLWINIEYQ